MKIPVAMRMEESLYRIVREAAERRGLPIIALIETALRQEYLFKAVSWWAGPDGRQSLREEGANLSPSDAAALMVAKSAEYEGQTGFLSVQVVKQGASVHYSPPLTAEEETG